MYRISIKSRHKYTFFGQYFVHFPHRRKTLLLISAKSYVCTDFQVNRKINLSFWNSSVLGLLPRDKSSSIFLTTGRFLFEFPERRVDGNLNKNPPMH